MSRGPGQLQRDILSRLQESESAGTPSTTAGLGWALAGEDPKRLEVSGALAEGVRAGELKASFYKAFRRALGGLCATRRVAITKRRLRTFDELVQFYPDRTKRLEVRELRRALLPHLAASYAGPGEVADGAELEDQLIRAHLASQPELATACASRWESIRSEVLGALTEATAPADRSSLLRLAVVGAAYFEGGTGGFVSSTSSLRASIDAVENVLSPHVVATLRQVHGAALPVERHQERMLKDVLFGVANFHRDRGRPTLKPAAAHALLASAPELVRSLPGFRPAAAHRGRDFLVPERNEVVFSEVMRHILDRHVFDRFEFISLAG